MVQHMSDTASVLSSTPTLIHSDDPRFVELHSVREPRRHDGFMRLQESEDAPSKRLRELMFGPTLRPWFTWASAATMIIIMIFEYAKSLDLARSMIQTAPFNPLIGPSSTVSRKMGKGEKKLKQWRGQWGRFLFCLLLTICYCGVCVRRCYDNDLILGLYYHWSKIYPLYAFSTFMYRSIMCWIMPKHPRRLPFFQCIIHSCRSHSYRACTRDSFLDWCRVGKISGRRAVCHFVPRARHVWVCA